MAVNSKNVVCFLCASAVFRYCLTLIFVFMKMCSLIAFAGGIVVGGMVGGAVALMFAPKKGEELRRDVLDKIAEVKKQMAAGTTVCHEGQCRRSDVVE